ncbi:ParB/RepB/Spo0J family partition protein [Eubacterium sp. OM08-24]|jgi:ParB family chromosome partitioning protein|uniref:ParB/RepB/Spo0J family partition protein n=1 Tax=Eubacterium sp. OM08-24 TaxID=2292352 RepID=UPI001FA905C8|nr:ParB/RepB/Spo0J family partition protein [Eubacterium sp. OM08-24]
MNDDQYINQQITRIQRSPLSGADNEEMNSLIESVQQQGIMTPLIVRPLENTTDEYEIISGHRRFRAAQKAELA